MGGPVRIGLLGCGTVGQGVVRMLAESRATIERASGHRLELGPILVRTLEKERPGVPRDLLTTDPAVVLDDPDVAVVVEVMGGIEPTLGYLRGALEAGKAVVTANKQLLSRHGPELLLAAEGPTPSSASRPRPAPRSRSSRCSASPSWPRRSRA
jgi:homoserine dehydrogenase